MRAIARYAAPALLVAAAACASTQEPPVAVSVSPADLSRLAGEWVGEYSSRATGRAGSIVFHLTADVDSAHGDVMMVPRGATSPLRRASVEDVQPVAAARPEPPRELTIRFVHIEGDRVSGSMDPYLDPECNCTAFTTFEGEVKGDRIEGTFTTRGASTAAPVTGTWSVKRRGR